jgi:hypothetical protein
LSGAVIPPWELSVIRKIDGAVLAIFNKTGSQKRQASDEADVEEQKSAIRAAGRTRRVVQRGKPAASVL